MNPLVRWVGSKRSLLPTLVSNLPTDINERLYLEPFAGSAALFFGCEIKRAILGDTNPGLMAMYNAVRSDPELLISHLSFLAHGHAQNADLFFLSAREQYNQDLVHTDPEDYVAFAARFMYLQATCFNGVYRTNKSGVYNVPIGDISKPRICDPVAIRAAHQRLQGIGLSCCDYRHVLNISTGNGRADHFAYVDPPYDADPGTKSFTAYSKSGFGPDKQRELAVHLAEFSADGGLFMASNADTALVRELYSGFKIIEVQGRRSVSQSGTGRGYVTELLVTNY